MLAGIIVSLILVGPYLWTVFNEPMMYNRAKNINTFKEGVNAQTFSSFAYNYMSHFNPQFLFIAGDPNYRHGAGVGTLYWIMLPLIIAGLLYLITANIPRRYKIFIVFWILIFPLGGSLTNDGVPHATRTLPGAPLLCMLSAAGFGAIFNFIKFKSGKAILSHGFALIMIGISLLSLGVFTRYYFSEYPIKSNGAWGYGHKKIFSTIKSLQDDYQRVCMENLNYTNELQLIRYYLPDTHWLSCRICIILNALNVEALLFSGLVTRKKEECVWWRL